MISSSRVLYVAIIALIFSVGCSKKEKVLIEVDFSQSDSWTYLLGADIYGTVATKDSQQSYSGSLRAFLRARNKGNSEGVMFGMEDVNLSAEFLSEAENFDLKNRIEEMKVSFSPQKGVSLSDSLQISRIPSGSWDILRSVARVVPVLPGSKMAVGGSWEREQQFPLNLKQGNATGMLYQVFRLDSLFEHKGNRTAALSWIFTYRVSLLSDSVPLAGKIPLAGSGRGHANVDLDLKKITRSRASFQVSHFEDSHIEFSETVHLEEVN
ncbi:MAG: hypothetical protein ACLFQB_07185 [Chitinispirillaceae bacterium]